jgi:hypothetical protein
MVAYIRSLLFLNVYILYFACAGNKDVGHIKDDKDSNLDTLLYGFNV